VNEVLSRIGQDLLGRVEALARQLLTGLTGFVSSAFNLGVLLFGAVFVAIYLLVDARRVEAAYPKVAPQRSITGTPGSCGGPWTSRSRGTW